MLLLFEGAIFVILRPLLPWFQARLLCGRGLEGSEEEELTWELCHSNVLTKSTLFAKLQTAALMTLMMDSVYWKQC